MTNIISRSTLALLLIAGLVLPFGVACEREEEGPAEELGESLDDMVDDLQDEGEDLGDQLKEAGEELEEGVKDAKDKVEEAIEGDG